MLSRSFAAAVVLSLFLCGDAMGQAIGQAIRAPVAEHEKALEQRVFYTGNLGWYYQAGVGGSLTMTGYDTTPHGGRITSVTACLYNESAFSRNFIACGLLPILRDRMAR